MAVRLSSPFSPVKWSHLSVALLFSLLYWPFSPLLSSRKSPLSSSRRGKGKGGELLIELEHAIVPFSVSLLQSGRKGFILRSLSSPRRRKNRRVTFEEKKRRGKGKCGDGIFFWGGRADGGKMTEMRKIKKRARGLSPTFVLFLPETEKGEKKEETAYVICQRFGPLSSSSPPSKMQKGGGKGGGGSPLSLDPPPFFSRPLESPSRR